MAKKVPSLLPLISVDAFTSVPFSGNGAAVCLVEFGQNALSVGLCSSVVYLVAHRVTFIGSTKRPADRVAEHAGHVPDELKQKVAAEINLSETAFVQALTKETDFKTGTRFGLRWFTPKSEVPLCGHATLAAAAVLFKCQGNRNETVVFDSLSGDLFCRRDEDRIIIDLPQNRPHKDEDEKLGPLLKAVVGDLSVQDVQYSPRLKKLLIRLDDKYTRAELESVRPDFNVLMELEDGSKVRGIILTLKGAPKNCCVDKDGVGYDFVSRYFAPWYGIDEDPVTGSAHTVLGPYWAEKLGKTKLYARQCSPRGGDLHVTVRDDDRVDVTGHATIIIRGHINLQ